MAQDAFLKIKEAESQAQKMINSAKEDASRIIKQAEEDAADASLRHIENCKRKALELKRQAEINARQDSERVTLETAELRAALREKLSLQKQKAVDAVIGMITE